MNKWRKPLSILTVIAVVAVSGVTWLMSVASAAGGQLYTSLGASTVTPGGTVSVNVRLNPGTPTDTVNVILNYDTSKMTYASVSYAGSPFDQHFGFSATGGQVTFAAAILGNSVSSDSLVAQINFTASSSGSGTASFNLTGSNAAYAGSATNPTLGASSSVSFVCPSGQTGTPPSCTTPSTGGTGSTGGGTGSTGGSTGGTKTTTPPKTGGSTSSTSSGGTGSTSATNTQPVGTPATVVSSEVQYTKATINCTTKTASTAYIRYGIDGNLTTNTAVDASGTTHKIALDPSTLLPGTTYSYVVVTTDASGKVSQTEVHTLKTKGLQVTLTVFDKNHKPLKNKTVTLHSDPITGKTDDKGNVTFSDVPLGNHSIVYAAGKTSYTKQITVVNNVTTEGETQKAAAQTFSIVYGFAESSLNMLWVWLGIIVVVVAVLGLLARSGRLGFAMQMRNNHDYAMPMSAPVVVGGNDSSPRQVGPDSTNMNQAQQISVQEHLDAIPGPSAPSPGSTVAPKDETQPVDRMNGQV
jgi:hypothetical protein